MREVLRSQVRHYSRALFEVAEEDGADESVRLRGDLRQFVELVEKNTDLQSVIEHPALTPEARGRALLAVAGSARGSALLGRLLGLLAARGHLGLLPALSEAFGALVNAARGVVQAQATGAIALSADQERALSEALAKTTGRKVELTARVDPRVLGGLQVKVGGRTYDGTVRAHLASLRRRLASGN